MKASAGTPTSAPQKDLIRHTPASDQPLRQLYAFAEEDEYGDRNPAKDNF